MNYKSIKALIVALLCLGSLKGYSNEIDSIKTIKQLNKFLFEKVDKNLNSDVRIRESALLPSNFDPYKFDPTAENENVFFKLDIDGNGLNDLLVCGDVLLVITDDSTKYNVHYIDKGMLLQGGSKLVNIAFDNYRYLLVINRFDEANLKTKTLLGEKDSLVFLFGGLIEYNASPDKLEVDSIIFSTSYCPLGSCPVFELRIGHNADVRYDAIADNDKKGVYQSKLNAVSVNRLVNTINYLKIMSLKERYAVPWTDDQTVKLEVKFTNGKLKKISDYGLSGTWGLSTLYRQLYDLRKEL